MAVKLRYVMLSDSKRMNHDHILNFYDLTAKNVAQLGEKQALFMK